MYPRHTLTTECDFPDCGLTEEWHGHAGKEQAERGGWVVIRDGKTNICLCPEHRDTYVLDEYKAQQAAKEAKRETSTRSV